MILKRLVIVCAFYRGFGGLMATGKMRKVLRSRQLKYWKTSLLLKAKAMAYSNMSQLKMLSDQTDECIYWGEKAIAIAKELNDEETLSHALNNVGTVQMRIQSS